MKLKSPKMPALDDYAKAARRRMAIPKAKLGVEPLRIPTVKALVRKGAK